MQALDAGFEMEQPFGQFRQFLFQLFGEKCRVYLQVETYVWMELQEQLEQLFGAARVVIEGPVKNTYIPYAVAVDILKPFADAFNGECAHRLFATADAECACIEASSGGFELHEWFVPIEETALFRWNKSGEMEYSGDSVVYISLLRIDVAKSRDLVPLFGLIPAGQPLGKRFFSFSSEHAIDEVIFA